MTASDLENLPIRETDTYSFCLPEEGEPVCSAREGNHNSFFFFYVDYITRLGLRFPFSAFQMAILQFLGVAPSQLHPNGWGYVIAFEWFCKMLGLPCTTSMFFYFFVPHTARSGKEPPELKGWTSIRGVPHRRLFTPVSDSFKHFKGNFFKVVAKSGVQPWFLKGPDSAQVDWEFNLYWSRDHHDVSLSAYKVERSTLLKPERKAIDAIIDYVKAKGTVGAASLVAQYRDEAWHQHELVSRPSLKMKGPPYLSAIPEPAAKGKKRSAGDAGKSKVGESSKPAETKKHKVGPSTVVTPASPVRFSPAAAMPPPKPVEGPSSVQDIPAVSRPSNILPRSLLWSRGITEELSVALLPPPRYQEPVPLLEVDTRELQSVGDALLKAAGLTQSFPSLHFKYEEAFAELKRARLERDEALKQWQVASNEFQAREVQLGKVEFALKETQGLLADSNVIIEGFKAAQAKNEKELTALVGERDQLKGECSALVIERDRIKAEGGASSQNLTAEVTRLRELLLGAVTDAFNNSLAQIRALNPGVELNTAGHHFRSYVEDGQMIPYVEPPATSETRVDGDAAGLETEPGEEASTIPAPES